MFEKLPDNEAFYTSSDILDFWDISYSSLFRIVKKHKLPTIRIGKEKAYKGSDLNNFLSNQYKAVSN